MAGRGQDKRGRSKKGPPFVMLDHALIDHPAFRALDPFALQVLIFLARAYKGPNKARIEASVRHVMKGTGQSLNRARKSLGQLVDMGFTIPLAVGHMGSEGAGVGTTWRLTYMPFEGTPATHEYREKWEARTAAENSESRITRRYKGCITRRYKGDAAKGEAVSREDTRKGSKSPEPVSREDTTLRFYQRGGAGDDAPDPAHDPSFAMNGTDPDGERPAKLTWRKPVLRVLTAAEIEEMGSSSLPSDRGATRCSR